ncbi:unnamed protein product [Phytophthora fragariaefolia]|uniref:Unnamed protein product n=1 Tax=Phytophthora fragariaefolia TaxID=1490495 RepID=A0A9W7CWB7_9STRA|nr:unnamed protein product [Phytophthora fragariaefolia]
MPRTPKTCRLLLWSYKVARIPSAEFPGVSLCHLWFFTMRWFSSNCTTAMYPSSLESQAGGDKTSRRINLLPLGDRQKSKKSRSEKLRTPNSESTSVRTPEVSIAHELKRLPLSNTALVVWLMSAGHSLPVATAKTMHPSSRTSWTNADFSISGMDWLKTAEIEEWQRTRVFGQRKVARTAATPVSRRCLVAQLL